MIYDNSMRSYAFHSRKILATDLARKRNVVRCYTLWRYDAFTPRTRSRWSQSLGEAQKNGNKLEGAWSTFENTQLLEHNKSKVADTTVKKKTKVTFKLKSRLQYLSDDYFSRLVSLIYPSVGINTTNQIGIVELREEHMHQINLTNFDQPYQPTLLSLQQRWCRLRHRIANTRSKNPGCIPTFDYVATEEHAEIW